MTCVEFAVEVNPRPVIAVELDAPQPIPVVTPDGARVVYAVTEGPRGPEGPAFSGVVMWYGDGAPPDLIVGSKPGDGYLDWLTGNLYRLGD